MTLLLGRKRQRQRRRNRVNTRVIVKRRSIPQTQTTMTSCIKEFINWLDHQRNGKLGILLNGRMEPWWRRRKFKTFQEFQEALEIDFASGAIPEGVVVKGFWFK